MGYKQLGVCNCPFISCSDRGLSTRLGMYGSLREKGEAVLCEVKTDRYFRSLYADPRWGTFLNKMGLDT
jgi:hypothetical protein